MLNCSERIPGLYFWVLLLVVRKYQGSRTLQTVGHPVAPSMSGSSNSFFAFLGSSFLVRITQICIKNSLLGMNVDRWFAIKFPEAYQKSLKTHHTWFIVGAWWLLALIPDLPLWFVPNFSSQRRHQLKKNVFFWALPEFPNPPPMTPIRATWSSFFGSRNSRFESQFRTQNTIYTL